ncbi:uncharacterized protein LOC110986765 isoform X2 [Acanthaster planci]|uniref:Uncharacterized protein LOC110986765 isoform X2 n=1 Tax=Acanthaster planci TaxID=133434 RepID=A0A8B7ZGA0_ACAPL|nr:uncharacterized protein LOC110986765 isoform X2 [Acanthaster planci]
MLQTAFIALVHTALWIICSAITLPPELQGAAPNRKVLHDMRRHFCSNVELHNASASCTSGPHGSRSLCGTICKASTDSFICYNAIAGPELCRGSCDSPYCRYEDAIVCQYAGRQCSCIYPVQEEKEYAPFCKCRNDASLPTFVYQNGSPITSCSNGISEPVSATSTPPSPQFTRPSPQPNVIAIVVGAVLSLVFLVIIVVVILWRCRILSTLMKKPSAQEDESKCAELGRTASSRAQLPESPVLGDAEYSYENDHWPQEPTALVTEDSNPTMRAGEHGDPEGNERYVFNGPGCAGPRRFPTTEAADAHPYFSLEGPTDNEVNSEHVEWDGVANGEVTASLSDSSSQEGMDHAYFEVHPTEEFCEHQSQTSAYEEVSMAGPAQNNGTSNSYQQLNRDTLEGSITHYQPLTRKAYGDLQTRNESYGDETERVTGATTENSVTSPYQHLSRTTIKRQNETEDARSNYEHLKGKAEYDLLQLEGAKKTDQDNTENT